MEYFYGLLDLSFWGYVAATFIMVQITMAAVTLYLHRDQAHRSIDLHPVLRHFFRFWIWCTSGMLTREWVAVHRKHHAYCETKDDPHSPQILWAQEGIAGGRRAYIARRKTSRRLSRNSAKARQTTGSRKTFTSEFPMAASF